MPSNTKRASAKTTAALTARVSRLTEKLSFLETKFKKLELQLATFNKQAIERRDRQTERQLRSKLGQS